MKVVIDTNVVISAVLKDWKPEEVIPKMKGPTSLQRDPGNPVDPVNPVYLCSQFSLQLTHSLYSWPMKDHIRLRSGNAFLFPSAFSASGP